MPAEIPVDLMATGGQLIPPGAAPRPPRARPVVPEVKPASEPAAAKDETAEKPHPSNCPHCGWNAVNAVQEPDPGDAQAFRNAVFSGDLYAKTVDLLDGAATVTFRDLSSDEEEAIRTRVVADTLKNPVTPLEMVEQFTDMRLSLAACRVRLGDKRYAVEPPADPYAEDFGARLKALRTFCKSDTVYRAVRWQYGRFVQVMGVLLSRATDRSFYSATGSGGGSPVSPPAA